MEKQPPFMLFASRLKLAMREKRMRPSELAEAVGASRSTVSRWRAGSLHPGRQKLALMAALLEKPIDFFAMDQSAETLGGANYLEAISDEDLAREVERRLVSQRVKTD